MSDKSLIDQAYEVALKAHDNAYPAYSKFHVGAAVKFDGVDELIPGCNVENLAYGSTICAERSAICGGISHHGKKDIEFIVVVTRLNPFATPCGACLQVIQEFAKPNTPIYLGDLEGNRAEKKLKDFLPNPFTEF